MKNITFLIFVIIALFITGCDYQDVRLKIVNKSNMPIAVVTTNNRLDTTFNNVEYYIREQIYMDKTKNLKKIGNSDAWNYYIKEGQTQTLYLFVFPIDTLEKYRNILSIQSLIGANRYCSYKSFSISQLDSLRWEIIIR
jgi:hypothetical protein